jgi:hypothetical protein
MNRATRIVIAGEHSIGEIFLTLYLFCLMVGMGVYLLVAIYHLI